MRTFLLPAPIVGTRMPNRRRLVIAIGASTIAGPFCAFAQGQTAKTPRVGILTVPPIARATEQIDALKKGLQALGYVEGKNISFEIRSADGNYERLPDLAANLVSLKPDVIVGGGTPGTKFAKAATATIPIVAIGVGDPIGSGLVASLARPGGNVTGTSNLSPPLMIKRLETLKEINPATQQYAVLLNSANPAQKLSFDAMEPAAKALKVRIQKFEVRDLAELQTAISEMAMQSIRAMVVGNDTSLIAHFRSAVELVMKQRILVAGSSEIAEAGGLIGYGSNTDIWRYSAIYIDKILKGAKPGDLPIEQPTRLDTVVNLKTAKLLGIKIPQAVLLRADKVVE